MSLKKLQLIPYNIAQLYTNSLLGAGTLTAETQKEAINYLGKNAKYITILVSDAANFYLNDTDFQLLTKMLGACKLTIEDVAIVNIAKTKINFTTLQTQLSAQQIILFGVSPLEIEMPIVFPEYHLQQYNNSTCLISHSLQTIANDTTIKASLWNCLKKMFSIA